MLVLQEEGKAENFSKNTKGMARTNNKLSPHMAQGKNRIPVALVGGERSHH